jgi:hypothetical protein
MPRIEDSEKNNTKKTPGRRSGGFPFDLTLPPLAVIILGLVMACILSQLRIATTAPFSIGGGQIAAFFTPEVQFWEHQIVAWGEAWNLDPDLVATVMQIESCGNPMARSGVGAMGLFQVMPYHFTDDEDPYKPDTNARRGLSYLKDALDARGGNSRLAFAGYNGGISGAKGSEYSWGVETIRYVYWATGIHKDAIAGKTHSERLDEWLAAGGTGLCNAARENLGLSH